MTLGQDNPVDQEVLPSAVRPLIGLTMGDPGGIGPELIVRALADVELRHQARFIVFGLDEALNYAADQAEIVPFWFRRPHDGVGRVESGVVVADFDEFEMFPAPVRQPTRQGGQASMRFLMEAITLARAGRLDALITGPASPESWRIAGYRFRTTMARLGEAYVQRRVRRLMLGGPYKVVPASDIEPLFSLWQGFAIGTVFQPIDLLNQVLKECFGVSQPRIAVCSLNPPHVADGSFGDEEHRVLDPAILMAREAGIRIHGPIPAPEAFSKPDGFYDGIVTMYYDQAAVPMRMRSPEGVISVTLGLPILHLEPDIGPCFESAGQGSQDPEPLRRAIRLACQMIRTRQQPVRVISSPV